MNPEFQRNLWIELTPRRLLLMAGILALAFFAAALPGTDWGPARLGYSLYLIIVILWGARNASMSVLGEIRDRTWDAQRLSSLDAGTMTWGKLFGSTIYNWFGGALCLIVLLSHTAMNAGPTVAAFDGIYFLAMGVLAHAAALLASLVGIRRRRAYGRLDISIYQAVGIGAALTFAYIWDREEIAAAFKGTNAPDTILWWGQAINDRFFLMASLAAFAAWTLVGCYRLMRLELKMENGPLVWLGFLLFMAVYAAGFDAWLHDDKALAGQGDVSLRLALVMLVFGALTYAMVFLEPKDQVHFRWLAAQSTKGGLGKVANSLPAWMMSYAGAMLAGLLLVLLMLQTAGASGGLFILSALGFMTRDVAIVLFMSMRGGRKRGDFAALALLAVLYVAAPMIVQAFGLAYVFRPDENVPAMSAIAAWVEAGGMAMLFLTRLFRAKAAD